MRSHGPDPVPEASDGREQWGSRLGFVLAAVGSAVGLGNMWRFSYLTAESGGAAFLVLYLGVVLAVGLPVMLAELVIGRGSRRSPIGALLHYGGPAWQPLGMLFVAAGLLILSYYSVIAGWTFRYGLAALTAGFPADSAAYFEVVKEGPDALAWHLAFMALTGAIVAGGVKRGIERTSLVLMPLLFAIVCGIALYAATLPGSGAGYRFYLDVDFSDLRRLEVLQNAASQAFFSLSLGMGAILTYASYLERDNHLPNESIVIAAADFGVAFMAGLAVFPLIFALGLEADVGEGTIGALFITLPTAFGEMGGGGRLVGVAFFVALAVGALTSAMSLLEVVVASGMDRFGWPRRRTVTISAALIALLGVPAALDIDVLVAMDKLAGNVFLVAGGLGLSLFVGWRMPDPMEEAARGAEGVRWFFLWRWLLRVPVPLVLGYTLVDLVRGLLAA